MLSRMLETPTLTTARLRLHPLRVADAAEMTVVLCDPALYTFIGGGPPSLADLMAQYARWEAGSPRAAEQWRNWIVREGGVAVGYAQATVDSDASTADIAWVIGTPWQGRGLGTEAARAVLDWLVSHGVETVTAHVHPSNVASARVAAKIGLAPTGQVEDGEVVWRLEGSTPRA